MRSLSRPVQGKDNLDVLFLHTVLQQLVVYILPVHIGGDQDVVVGEVSDRREEEDVSFEEFFSGPVLVNNADQFQTIGFLKRNVGYLGNLVRAGERHLFNSLLAQFGKDFFQVVPRLPVNPGIIMQEIVGQPRLLGEPLRGQVIGIAFWRNGFNGDEPFCDQVLYIRIDQAESNAETAAQVALSQGIVV